MGKSIGSLKKEALAACKARGHNMNKFTNSGKTSTSYCRTCAAYVDVTPKPLPNGINLCIGGSALGRDCYKSSLSKGVIRDIRLRSSVGHPIGGSDGTKGGKGKTPRSDIKKIYVRVWAGVKAKQSTVKKTIKGTGKGAKLEKWQCKKGGANYWRIPVAKPLQPDGTPRTTVGKCVKCREKRTFGL